MSFTFSSTVSMAGSAASICLNARMFASLSLSGSNFARMILSPSPLGVTWAPFTSCFITSATAFRRASSAMLLAAISRSYTSRGGSFRWSQSMKNSPVGFAPSVPLGSAALYRAPHVTTLSISLPGRMSLPSPCSLAISAIPSMVAFRVCKALSAAGVRVLALRSLTLLK